MKTLISMTDFVLELKNEIKLAKYGMEKYYESMYKAIKYAEFLKQPLKLEMFVPCVNGDPFNYSKHGNKEDYEQAHDKVLFEGFEYIETENYFFVFNEEKLVRLQRSNFKTETIEFIAGQEVELTPTALKQIGL